MEIEIAAEKWKFEFWAEKTNESFPIKVLISLIKGMEWTTIRCTVYCRWVKLNREEFFELLTRWTNIEKYSSISREDEGIKIDTARIFWMSKTCICVNV